MLCILAGMGATNSATAMDKITLISNSECDLLVCRETVLEIFYFLGIVTGSSTLPQSMIVAPYNGC